MKILGVLQIRVRVDSFEICVLELMSIFHISIIIFPYFQNSQGKWSIYYQHKFSINIFKRTKQHFKFIVSFLLAQHLQHPTPSTFEPSVRPITFISQILKNKLKNYYFSKKYFSRKLFSFIPPLSYPFLCYVWIDITNCLIIYYIIFYTVSF